MSTSLRVLPPVRTAFSRLVDYAGLFPPAKLAMAPSVREYEQAQRGNQAWMLGRFIVPASRVDELEAAEGGAAIERSVIIDTAADARAWFSAAQLLFDRLSARDGVACLEVPLPKLTSKRDTYDAIVGQLAMLAEKAGLRDRPIYVEFPRDERFKDLLSGAMTVLARYGMGAKIRCGGVVAEAFPSVDDVTAFIRAASDGRVPFKATAGLHHPIRHLNVASGFTMHGFLNVLVAAVFARRVDDATLRAIVSEEKQEAFRFDEAGLHWDSLSAGDEEIAAAREHGFVAYGSCSFAEPVEDLMALEILPK